MVSTDWSVWQNPDQERANQNTWIYHKTTFHIIIQCILTIYRHTAYQVVHLQIPAIEVYQLVIVKMNPKRNLAKLTFTLGAFHQGPLMKI